MDKTGLVKMNALKLSFYLALFTTIEIFTMNPFMQDVVFKMDTNNCLEDIIEQFTINKKNDRFLIFKEDIYNQLFE